VDDLFCVGDQEFYHRVASAIQQEYQICSEDTNDVLCVGQGVRCRSEDNKSFIQVDQERGIEELGEIEFDKKLRDTDFCQPALHTQYRSVLGQVNWLQSRTQYRACYRFSRGVSAAASPTIADVKQLNKSVRSIRSEPCVLRYWPVQGKLRLIGYPDAAYRNNADNSSQRGQTIFLVEERTVSKDGFRFYDRL
jgi:hypothetical protein